MEKNTVTVIVPQYDENGTLKDVSAQRTDIRNAGTGYVWNGKEIQKGE